MGLRKVPPLLREILGATTLEADHLRHAINTQSLEHSNSSPYLLEGKKGGYNGNNSHKGAKQVGGGATHHADRKLKKALKRVAWADEVGGNLNEVRIFHRELNLFSGICSRRPGEDGVIVKHEGGRVEDSTVKEGQVGFLHVRSKHSFHPELGSYKKALLRPPKKQTNLPIFAHKKSAYLSRGRKPMQLWRAGRCFRCLAADNRVANCRDPVRCLACRRTGHWAYQCRKEGLQGVESGFGSMNLNRVVRRRGRVPSMKAFVPC